MYANDNLKEQIFEKLDIVDIVGEAVDLHRKGNNYWGLCPFHHEKTPSFSVSQDKGIYKCFGCGVSGNIITFQMEYYRMTFIEALKELARKAGLEFQEHTYSHVHKEELSKRDLVVKALVYASNYYKKMLYTTSGKIALSYLQKRDFSPELIEKFSLGYSPDSWDSLVKEMRKQSFADNFLIDSGLVIEKDDGDLYDRFRNRVMFPIHDHLGTIVGFGARLLDDEMKQAKYINSPQSIVYDKSKILYGLFQAKEEIRRKGFAILTEGYADVLTLHQAGYRNAVASSGTSLTKEQLINLYRYSKKLTIVYDADSAGIKAAERGLELALEHGFTVKIALLPQGEDPDSIIRKLGNKNFQIYLNEAKPFIDFLVDQFKKDGRLDSPDTKADSIRMLMEIISKIPDKLQHDDYMNHLSQLLNLSDRQLTQIYKEKSILEKKRKIDESRRLSNQIQKSFANEDNELIPDANKNSGIIDRFMLPEEEHLISIALNYNETIPMMTGDFAITADKFHSEFAKVLFSHIVRLSEKNSDLMKEIFEDVEVPEDLKNIMTDYIFSNEKSSDRWSEFSNRENEIDFHRNIQDALIKLDLRTLENARIILQNQFKPDTPMDKQIEIMKELKQLNQKKQKLEQLLLR
jgi:DNA primase